MTFIRNDNAKATKNKNEMQKKKKKTTMKRAEGNEHFKARRFVDAISCYRSARDGTLDNEELAILWNNEAAALLELGRYDEALCCCDNSMKHCATQSEYLPKVEDRRMRLQKLLELNSSIQGEEAWPCVAEDFLPSFEYFPVGHDIVQDVLSLRFGEYSVRGRKNRNDNGSPLWEALVKGSPSSITRKKRVLLAASSDPRHILGTVAAASASLWRSCRAFGFSDDCFDTGEKVPNEAKMMMQDDGALMLVHNVDAPPKKKMEYGGAPIEVELLVNDIVPEVLARSVMLIVLVRCAGYGLQEKAPQWAKRFDFCGTKAFAFFTALTYHLWGSINLAPPFHNAYKELLRMLVSFVPEWNTHPLTRGIEFAQEGLLEQFVEMWTYWLETADSIPLSSCKVEDPAWFHRGQEIRDEVFKTVQIPEEDEFSLEDVKAMLSMKPELIEKASQASGIKKSDVNGLATFLLSQIRPSDAPKNPFKGAEDSKKVEAFLLHYWPKEYTFHKNNLGMFLPCLGFDEQYPKVTSHKTNSCLLTNQRSRGYKHGFLPQTYHDLFFLADKNNLSTKSDSMLELFMLQHGMAWTVFTTFLPPKSMMQLKIRFSCQDMIHMRDIPGGVSRIFLSNVPDYVNALNVLSHVPFRKSCTDGAIMAFDAVCTLPVWILAGNGNLSLSRETYLWTHGRLNTQRLAALGWAIDQERSNGMSMIYRAVPHALPDMQEWQTFLEDLFFLIAYPYPRHGSTLEVVPGITMSSLLRVVRAAVLVPVHWSQKLFNGLLAGTLSNSFSVGPPQKCPEMPSTTTHNKAKAYNVKPFSLEMKTLLLHQELDTFVGPLREPDDHMHRNDIRCILVHPKDEMAVRKCCSASLQFQFEMMQGKSQQSTSPPAIQRIVDACKEPVHMITCVNIIGPAEQRQVSFKLPKQDLEELAKKSYLVVVFMPAYYCLIDIIPICKAIT